MVSSAPEQFVTYEVKSDKFRRRAVEEIGLDEFSNVVPQFMPGLRLGDDAFSCIGITMLFSMHLAHMVDIPVADRPALRRQCSRDGDGHSSVRRELHLSASRHSAADSRRLTSNVTYSLHMASNHPKAEFEEPGKR
jgi:hypothetical protein